MGDAGNLAECHAMPNAGVISMPSEFPSLQSSRVTWSAASLFQAVLPAATAEEILQRLAETISAEALFVERLRWPQWLGVQRQADHSLTVNIVEQTDVPDGGLRIGPARLLGGYDSFDESAFDLLVRQAQALDAHQLDEKLAAMAELAAGAGHEVNNPLGSIVGRASLLLKGENDPERRRTLAAIVSQAYRGRDMIGDLMLFARPPAPLPESVDVESAIDEVCSEFSDDLRDRQLAVEGLRGQDLAVWADATQFRIVLCELIRNSLHFAPRDSTIDISTSLYEGDVLISVSDCGPSLSEVERRHLFDPFFSGRQAGRGLGFGLTKCWRIAKLHGGSIAFDDAAGVNRFQVSWPIATCSGPAPADMTLRSASNSSKTI